eukprot:CAMPEP_0178439524 /NCGR_PEP_ID=MMETSP0689_2-20121128/36205_1 /TAXON_ID=160604 /ORGANISM="Amphidinium massartii, Strain CS-259" /LENGTH=105 /DNA_ID=CAMNT_0020062065 /DNA_START=63 /DNA_END=380 /DNA_ORIENTATION=-
MEYFSIAWDGSRQQRSRPSHLGRPSCAKASRRPKSAVKPGSGMYTKPGGGFRQRRPCNLSASSGYAGCSASAKVLQQQQGGDSQTALPSTLTSSQKPATFVTGNP